MDKIRYIFLLMLCVWMAGCSDELLIDDQNGAGASMSRMEIELETSVPLGDFRTRGVDALGSTDLRSLWVGVYDVQTGNRVGGSHFRYPGQTVKVPVVYYDAHPSVVIVGVANYDGLTDWDGKDLTDCIDDADTWNAFVDLNVRVPLVDGAPVVDTNQPPLMMGLLTTADAPRPFFGTSESGAVSIDNSQGAEVVNLNPGSIYGPMTKTVTGKKLYMRRLYAQVNVTITAGAQAEVTDVSFRRCNMPLGVFVAEHPTYVGPVVNWNPYSQNSPNFVDKVMEVKKGVPNTEGCYQNDGQNEWIRAGLSNTFSFAHYENKHWAPSNDVLPDHDAREKGYSKTGGVLEYLQHAYNNQASYFVVRMKILDKQLDRSAYVEYVIHEGNVNNHLGEIETGYSRAKDYAAFRNMAYNYNITVNGIDYITYNVTAGEEHRDGASGEIWGAEPHSLTPYTVWDWSGRHTEYYYTRLWLSAKDKNSVFRFYAARGENTNPLDYINGDMPDDINAIYWPAIDGNTQTSYIPYGLGDIIRVVNPDNNSVFNSLDEFVNHVRNTGGNYEVRFYPSNETAQWYPEAYKIGMYYYSSIMQSGLSGTDVKNDGCTTVSGHSMHVIEWKPEQKKAVALNSLSNNLPSPSSTNIMDEKVVLDFNSAHNASQNGVSYNYGTDFYYLLTYKGIEYKLGPDLTFEIPMKETTQTGYSIKAVAINTKELKDSPSTTGSFSLTNPYGISFKGSAFRGFFQSNFGNAEKITVSEDTEKLYQNYYYICVRKSKTIGFVNQDSKDTEKTYLYFNNTGDGNGIKFRVYKDCKIYLTTYLTEGGRTVYIDGNGENISKTTPQQTKTEETLSPTTVTLNENEQYKDISIYYMSNGGYMVGLTITEN